MSKKLTPWFPGDVKPTRKGVYERDFVGQRWVRYNFWTGSEWRDGAHSPNVASLRRSISALQEQPWRGLATPTGEHHG